MWASPANMVVECMDMAITRLLVSSKLLMPSVAISMVKHARSYAQKSIMPGMSIIKMYARYSPLGPCSTFHAQMNGPFLMHM